MGVTKSSKELHTKNYTNSYVFRRDSSSLFLDWISMIDAGYVALCQTGLSRVLGIRLSKLPNTARVRVTITSIPTPGYTRLRFREAGTGWIKYTTHATAIPRGGLMSATEALLERLGLRNSTVYIKGEVLLDERDD